MLDQGSLLLLVEVAAGTVKGDREIHRGVVVGDVDRDRRVGDAELVGDRRPVVAVDDPAVLVDRHRDEDAVLRDVLAQRRHLVVGQWRHRLEDAHACLRGHRDRPSFASMARVAATAIEKSRASARPARRSCAGTPSHPSSRR